MTRTSKTFNFKMHGLRGEVKTQKGVVSKKVGPWQNIRLSAQRKPKRTLERKNDRTGFSENL